MCTSITSKLAVSGSAKGAAGWMPVSAAVISFDHPHHTPLDHALSIDFLNEAAAPGTRVAVELSADSARALARSIEAALAQGEAEELI
jgi:hypothetical protein